VTGIGFVLVTTFLALTVEAKSSPSARPPTSSGRPRSAAAVRWQKDVQMTPGACSFAFVVGRAGSPASQPSRRTSLGLLAAAGGE
jgi:hypothetical protein